MNAVVVGPVYPRFNAFLQQRAVQMKSLGLTRKIGAYTKKRVDLAPKWLKERQRDETAAHRQEQLFYGAMEMNTKARLDAILSQHDFSCGRRSGLSEADRRILISLVVDDVLEDFADAPAAKLVKKEK